MKRQVPDWESIFSVFNWQITNICNMYFWKTTQYNLRKLFEEALHQRKYRNGSKVYEMILNIINH